MDTKEIMKLADDYAALAYFADGPESSEARAALQSALEEQAAEIERLKLHIKHIRNLKEPI